MLFEKRGGARFSKPFWNNPAVLVRIQRRRRARWARICNRPGRDPSLFAAMVWRRTNPPPLLFLCWRFRSAGRRASRPRHRALPGCPDRPRSCRSLLPWPLLCSKLSRSFLLGFFFRRLRLLFGCRLLRCRSLIFFGVRLMFRYSRSRILQRRPNDYVTAILTRPRATDQNHFFVFP